MILTMINNHLMCCVYLGVWGMSLCMWKNVCEFARKLIKINGCLG